MKNYFSRRSEKYRKKSVQTVIQFLYFFKFLKLISPVRHKIIVVQMTKEDNKKPKDFSHVNSLSSKQLQDRQANLILPFDVQQKLLRSYIKFCFQIFIIFVFNASPPALILEWK